MNTIVMSSPIYVAPLAFCLLNERCTCFQAINILVAVVGVVLITRPTPIFGEPPSGHRYTSTDQLTGASLALVAAVGVSLGMISLRKVPQTSSTVVIIWFSLVSIVFGCIIAYGMEYVVGVEPNFPDTKSEWIWINWSAIFWNSKPSTLRMGFEVRVCGCCRANQNI